MVLYAVAAAFATSAARLRLHDLAAQAPNGQPLV